VAKIVLFIVLKVGLNFDIKLSRRRVYGLLCAQVLI
jgi:hypothetical protein